MSKPIKLFLRTDTQGNTVVFGKVIGKIAEPNEAVFEGVLTEGLLLIGEIREPKDRTDCYSIQTLMRELGDV